MVFVEPASQLSPPLGDVTVSGEVILKVTLLTSNTEGVLKSATFIKHVVDDVFGTIQEYCPLIIFTPLVTEVHVTPLFVE